MVYAERQYCCEPEITGSPHKNDGRGLATTDRNVDWDTVASHFLCIRREIDTSGQAVITVEL